MNRLPNAIRSDVVVALCVGASMRGIARSFGISINTVTALLVEAGQRSQSFRDRMVRGLDVRDMIAYSQPFRIVTGGVVRRRDKVETFGAWAWLAFDVETRLSVTAVMAQRDRASAALFLDDVRGRLAVAIAGPDIALLDALTSLDRPFQLSVVRQRLSLGDLSVRLPQTLQRVVDRRFTRTGTAYSRKIEHLGYMTAIYAFWHDFVKIDRQGGTPAMRAGIADAPLTMDVIIG